MRNRHGLPKDLPKERLEELTRLIDERHLLNAANRGLARGVDQGIIGTLRGPLLKSMLRGRPDADHIPTRV